MKRVLVLLTVLLTSLSASALDKTPDSLRIAYSKAKADSTRADILKKLAGYYTQNKPDSELIIAHQALILSQKIKYLTGEMQDLKMIAEAYEYLGNYPLSLQYYLQRLKLDEQNPNPERQVATLLSIGNLYQLEGDYKLALAYAQKGYFLVNKYKLEPYRWYSYMTFGDTYDRMNDVQDAVVYDKKAYELALNQKNNAWLGMCLNNMANVYVKDKQYDVALGDYRKGIPYLKASNNASFLCESYQGIAGILLKKNKPDSAVFYARASLDLAVSRSFDQKFIRSCQELTEIYEAKHMADSALVYQGKLLMMKDSIYSRDKEKELANLSISEEIRQKDRQQEKLEEDKERSYKLNMLMIGLLIPFSFLVSLVLSKRKMHPKIIEFSGIISLLLLFEYLTVLLHPLVVNITNHSAFLEVLIFVCIAAVLTPSHHRLEHWMLQKLTAHKHQNVHPQVEAAAANASVLAEKLTSEDSSLPKNDKK